VALQSLAYVPDVARAIGEIARVLRPGGRAVVLDTDFASVVWHGRDQARVDRILAAYDAHVAHPGLPRRLSRLASDAGLVTVRREVVPILNASFHPDTFAYGIAPFIRNFVVDTGRVPAGEADACRGAGPSVCLSAFRENLIHHLFKRPCRVYCHAVARYGFFCPMESSNDFPFLWFRSPVSWV